MSRATKWAIGTFLVHAIVVSILISLGMNTDFYYRVEAAQALSRLEFAVDPAARWLVEAASPIIRSMSNSWKLSLSSAINAFAYPAYIVLGGVFYGLLAWFVAWFFDRRAKGRAPRQESNS